MEPTWVPRPGDLAAPNGGRHLGVPAGLVAGWLRWTFDVSRETAAAFIDLSVLPAIVGVRTRNPTCPADGVFATCDPGPVWPWAVVALVLVVVGSAIMATPTRRRREALAPTI